MNRDNESSAILIVDDNNENLRVLKTYLNEDGYKVLIASNGKDALERVQRNRPVIILMDVQMPGMDGFEVCAKIKENAEIKHIPIIFVTAYNDAENISRGFEVGGADYITKPIRKLELLARVQNHIQIVNVKQHLEKQVKERTQELWEREQRFNLAMNAARDGLFDWNLITNEVYYSPAWKKMLGYEDHELPNDFSVWETLTNDEDVKKTMEKIDLLIDKKIDRFEIEFKMKHKHGHWVDVLSRAEAIFDDNGKAIRIVGTHLDFSERKQFELQLKEKNEELLIAKEKAEESDRLKSEFLNNMSHEIRTPMNGIIGFSEQLSNPGITDEKRNYYAKIVQNCSMQLLKIIDDILEISTLETKQVKLREELFCLNDLLMELFSVFNLKSKERKISIYVKKALTDNQSFILLDKTKLSKILSNLIENAIKFTNEGFVEVGYSIEQKNLVIYVKDTGMGIDFENQDRIFKRFTQESETVSQKHGGLGLGLSISKENARLLGGDITVESEKGKGAKFILTIPYKPNVDQYEVVDNHKKNKDENIDDFTILVAEDEEVNFMYIELLVEQYPELKYRIIHAKNGKEAIDICMSNNINLVLMDLKMPVMDGLEAAEKIKLQYPKLPIIAQTAYTTDPEKDLALRRGCDDFITKPIKEEELFELINKYSTINT